ncbi:MAG: hypothetical protein ACLVIP_04350 [Ruminococcus sp.]
MLKSTGIDWLAIQPKASVGLIALRKDRAKVQNISGLNCAIFLKSTTLISRKNLSRTASICTERQAGLFAVYRLPAVNSGERDIAPVDIISYDAKANTYGNLRKVEQGNSIEAATKLGVSKRLRAGALMK